MQCEETNGHEITIDLNIYIHSHANNHRLRIVYCRNEYAK